MGEFASLQKDILPIFEEIQQLKEKYKISSITLESNRYTEKIHGSHGGKGNFVGEREHRYARNPKKHFIQIK